MKVAALILGLIGALLVTGLGSKWLVDYKQNRATIESLASAVGGSAGQEAIASIERTHRAAYAMVVLGIAALAASALVFKKSKAAGGVMIAAAIVPALFAPSTLVFSFLLLLAGIFALVAKQKPAAAPASPASASAPVTA